jgi:hypothetical protein
MLTLLKAPNPLGPGWISVVPFRFDTQCRIGTLVVASARKAAMALREAQQALEQKRLGMELEQRVALRTAELTEANRELMLLKDELATELLAMSRLHELSTRPRAITELPAVLDEVLTATITGNSMPLGTSSTASR